MDKKKKRIINYSLHLFFLTIVSVCIFIFLIIRGIYLPYVGYNAWNYNTYSLIAHNYNTYGWIETKLAPITSVSENLPIDPQYYLHHPPLISVMLAIFFNFFGESFLIGRLTVIIFSFISLGALYGIAYELKGRVFASITAILYSLLPASVLFGRMIGQEPLVLSFALVTLYSILRYFKTHNNLYFFSTIITTIMGVLSDWPMIYFIFSIFPWLIYKKEIKLAITLGVIAIGGGMIYLGYIFWIMEGFTDLYRAISVRSLGALTQLSFWPFRWIVTILTRIFFYFNPLIISLILFSFLFFQKNIKLSKEHLLLYGGLTTWGFLHVILFPEGSFGHPYWVYYFLPTIMLFSSCILLSFYEKKMYILLGIIYILLVMYVVKVENWKTKEVQGNVWRYEIAKSTESIFSPYSSFTIHPISPVDYDLFRYVFRYDVDVQAVSALAKAKKTYVYICQRECGFSDDLKYLINTFHYQKKIAKTSEIYVFSLDKKQVNPQEFPIQTKLNSTDNKAEQQSIAKRIYHFLLKSTSMPQL